MDSIKRMFRGLFKRGGNKRKAGEDKAVGARTGQRESPLPPLAPPKDTPPATASTPAKVAAQIAASPTRSPTQALPPSHPLATGQRRPLQPSPPDRDTNGGLAVGAGQAVVGRTSEQAQVSPRAITSAQAAEVQPRTSDAVSAMTEEPAAPSTSKVDSAVADLQTPKTSQADAAGALAPAAPSHPTITAQKLDPAVAANKENLQPNPESTASEGLPTDAPPAATPQQLQPATPTSPTPVQEPRDDDKMLVTEEPPPPIVVPKVAPGMSATSGPLDDFPEGGYTQD